jgi:hypothetical protein
MLFIPVKFTDRRIHNAPSYKGKGGIERSLLKGNGRCIQGGLEAGRRIARTK